LTWRLKRFQGSIRRIQIGDSVMFHQWITLFNRAWAWSLEGSEETISGSQIYQLNGFYSLHPTVLVSHGIRVDKQSTWKIPKSFSEVRWRSAGTVFRARIEQREDVFREILSGYWEKGAHQFSLNLALQAAQNPPSERLQFNWNYTGHRGISLLNRFTIHQQEASRGYLYTFYHTLNIPVGIRWQWQPIIGEELLSWEFRYLGSGFYYQGEYPFYGQVLFSSQAQWHLVDYQLAGEIPLFFLPRKNRLLLWGNLQQQGGKIERTELRFQPTGGEVQPGIYYSFIRSRGSRLEGYLQWRW
ncbi:MAG: hypothetical protein D6748_07275, partial [Calditrichaeota bacterium]